MNFPIFKKLQLVNWNLKNFINHIYANNLFTSLTISIEKWRRNFFSHKENNSSDVHGFIQLNFILMEVLIGTKLYWWSLVKTRVWCGLWRDFCTVSKNDYAAKYCCVTKLASSSNGCEKIFSSWWSQSRSIVWNPLLVCSHRLQQMYCKLKGTCID